MKNISVVVVTPQGYQLKTKAQQVRLPASDGECEIRDLHTEMVKSLQAGVMSLGPRESEEKFFVDRGYVRIYPDAVEVIVEVFEKPSQIDKKRAKDSLERAEKNLQERDLDKDIDTERSLLSLKRAQLRLSLAAELAA
jgi:F-type H+-transporting ATPase subunit epsilon